MNSKGIDSLGDNGVCIPVSTHSVKSVKKQTRADVIRSMNDEELANFLSKTVWEEGANLFDCADCECVFPCTECRMYLDWLQSEAE